MFKQSSEFWRGRNCLWLARGLLGSLICGACVSISFAATPNEGELRAAVIIAIMRFTSWEAIAPEESLEICLLGKPLSGDVLLAVGGEQKVAAHTLSVRSIQDDINNCQVMVIGSDIDNNLYERLIAQADGQSILTVCDGCRRGFGEDAIIQLRLRQQRVSFEVNLARARSNNVALDAQLLELATLVRR